MKNPKSFEEGMARLQELLDRLASPDTPLEEAIFLHPAALQGWGNKVTYHERLKPSYYTMQALWR